MERSDIVSQKEVQNSTIGGKSDFDTFWEAQGPILEHCQERGTTVNSVRYSEMLWDHMKPAILTKRLGLLSKGVAMLHGNTRPHTAAHTAVSVRHLNFKVLKHPPYSPDLASSDYHPFDLISDPLRGRHFASDQEVKEAVRPWLVTQSKTSFSEGTRKLVDFWTKCVEKDKSYIEN
jgi:histone-lysine N-methyltransferase SETMAR